MNSPTPVCHCGPQLVIADPGSWSGAGLIRNPVSAGAWIPDVETPDLIRGRDDNCAAGMTIAAAGMTVSL